MAEDNIVNDPTKQGQAPVNNNPLEQTFNMPGHQTYDLIDAFRNGVNPSDIKLGEGELVSVHPKNFYTEQNPAWENNPDFDKFYDQSRQMALAINDEKWKGYSATSADRQTFPGLDVPGFSMQANLNQSSRLSAQGGMYATPQEWATASGKYVEFNPITGEDEVKEMSWWDRNAQRLSVVALANPISMYAKFAYDIVDGENFIYDYDLNGNSFIRKVKSIDDLDDREIVSMWGPQKLYDDDWYAQLAGFITESPFKLVRSVPSVVKSFKDFGLGVYAGVTTDTEQEKQQKLDEFRTEGISANVDKMLNTAVNKLSAMTYSPSVKLEGEGWFGSLDGFTYQMSVGLGQLAGQIAATYALGGAGALSSLTGRFGASAIKSTAQTAAKNEFAQIAKQGFKAMGNAATRYTVVGTAVALDDVYRSARVTGLRREDAGLITALSAPFVFATERLISAGYFGKMFEGDSELVRRGFRQIMRASYENVMKSGVKIGSKEFVASVNQEVKKGLLNSLKNFTKGGTGKFADNAFVNAGRKLFEIGVQAPLREGIQEGLEETGYVGVEHVWDHWLGKWMDDNAKYGTEFYSRKSIDRIEDNFIAGFMIGMAGAGVGHVGKSVIRGINKNKPGVVDAKNNALEAAILDGQKEEIIEKGRKLWEKGMMNSPDKNTSGDLIELGTEEQQSGIEVEHNRYEKYGLKEGRKLTTLNDLAYYNFLETLERKEIELFGIYNEIRNKVENMDAFNEMMNTPGADVRLRQKVNELRDEQDELREDLYNYNEIKETQGEDIELERKLEERKEALRQKKNAFDREFVMSSNKADLFEKDEELKALQIRKNNGEDVDAEINIINAQRESLLKDEVTSRSKYSRNYLNTIRTGVYNKIGSQKKDFVPKSIDELSAIEDYIIQTGQKIKSTASKVIENRRKAKEQFVTDATSALNEAIRMLDEYRNTNVTSLQEGADGKKEVVSKSGLRERLAKSLSQLDQIITGSNRNIYDIPELRDSQIKLRSLLREEFDKTFNLMGSDENEVDDYLSENPDEENTKYYNDVLNKYVEIGGEPTDIKKEEVNKSDSEKSAEESSEFVRETIYALFNDVYDLKLQLPPVNSDNLNKDIHGPIIRKAIELITGVEGVNGVKEKYGIQDFINNLGLLQQVNNSSPIDNASRVKSHIATNMSIVLNRYKDDPGAFVDLQNAEGPIKFTQVLQSVVNDELVSLKQYEAKSGLGVKLKFERDLINRSNVLGNKITSIRFSIIDDHTIISKEAKDLYFAFVDSYDKWVEKVSAMTREEFVNNLEAISAAMVEYELNMMRFESQMYKDLSGKENRNERVALLDSIHNQVENQLPKEFRVYSRGYIANAENLAIKNTLFQKRTIGEWIDFLKTGHVTEEFYQFMKENGFYDISEVGTPIETTLVQGILVSIDTFFTNYVNEISTKDSEGFYAFLKTYFNDLYSDTDGRGFRPNISQEEALKVIYSYLSQTTDDGFVYLGNYGLDENGKKTTDSFDRYIRSLLISGYGGTGKTMMVTSTTLGIIDSFEANNTGDRKKMIIITPSKSLASGVFTKERSSYNYDIEVIEHSEFFSKMESDEKYWESLTESNDYIVIDEASRITGQHVNMIRASKPGAKILLTGDHYQSRYGEDREHDTAAMAASDMVHTVELTEIHRSGVEFIHNVVDSVVSSMSGLQANPVLFSKTYYTPDHKKGVRYTKTTSEVEKAWLNDINDSEKGLDGREIIFATSDEAEAFSSRNSLTDEQKANVRYIINTEGKTPNGNLINPVSIQGLAVSYAYVAVSQGTTMTERKDFNTAIGRAKKFLMVPGSTVEELSEVDQDGSKIMDYSDASNTSLQDSLNKANEEFNQLSKTRMESLGSGSMEAINELIKKYQEETRANQPVGGQEHNPNNEDQVVESNEVFNARKAIKTARANNDSTTIVNTLLSVNTPKLVHAVYEATGVGQENNAQKENIKPGVSESFKSNSVIRGEDRHYERNVNGRIEVYQSVSDATSNLLKNTEPFNKITWGTGDIRNTEHGNIIDNATTFALLRYYQDKITNDTSDTPEAIARRKTYQSIIDYVRKSEGANTTSSFFENNGLVISENKYKKRFTNNTFHFTKDTDAVARFNNDSYLLIKENVAKMIEQYDYVIPQYVVFDEANKIAGTMDFVGIKNGTFGIIDVKSKKYGAAGITVEATQQNEIPETNNLDDLYYESNGMMFARYGLKDFLQQQVYSKMLSNLGADTGTTTLDLMIFKPFEWDGKKYKNLGRNGNNVFKAQYVGMAHIKYQSTFVDQILPKIAKEPEVTTQTQQQAQSDSMVDNGPFSSTNNGIVIKSIQVGDVIVTPNGNEQEVIKVDNDNVTLVGTEPGGNESEITGKNSNFSKGTIVQKGRKTYLPTRSANLYLKSQVLPMTMLSVASEFAIDGDPDVITKEQFWDKVKENDYFNKRNRILNQSSDLVVSYEQVSIWEFRDDGMYAKKSVMAAVIRKDKTTGDNNILGALALPHGIKSSKTTNSDIAKRAPYTEDDFLDYEDKNERQNQVVYQNALLEMHKQIIAGKKSVNANAVNQRIPVVKYKFGATPISIRDLLSDQEFSNNYELLDKNGNKATSIDAVKPYYDQATDAKHGRYYVLARPKNGSSGTEFRIDLAYSGATTNDELSNIQDDINASFSKTQDFIESGSPDDKAIAEYICQTYWYQFLKQNIRKIANKVGDSYVSRYPDTIEIKRGKGKLFSINAKHFKSKKGIAKIQEYAHILGIVMAEMSSGEAGTIYPPFSYSRNAGFIEAMKTRAIAIHPGAPSVTIDDYKEQSEVTKRSSFNRNAQTNLLEATSVATTLYNDANEYLSKVMGVAWDPKDGWFIDPRFKDGKQILGYFLDGVKLWDASGKKQSVNMAHKHEAVHWMFTILDAKSRREAYDQAKRHMLQNFRDNKKDGQFMNVNYSQGIEGISDWEAEEWIAEVNRGKQEYNEKVKNGSWLHRFINWFRGLFNISELQDNVEALLADLNAGKFANSQAVRSNTEPLYLAENNEFDLSDKIDKLRVEKKLNGPRNVIFAMNYVTQLFYQNSRFDRFIDEVNNEVASRSDAESWRAVYSEKIHTYKPDDTLSVEGIELSQYDLSTNYARELAGEPKDVMIDRRAKNYIKKVLSEDQDLFNDIVSLIVPDYDFNEDNYNVETREMIEHGQINTNVSLSRLAKMFLRTIPAFKWVRDKRGYHIVNLKQNVDGQIMDYVNPENFATHSNQTIDYSEMESSFGRYMTEFRSSEFYDQSDIFTDFMNFLADKVNNLTLSYRDENEIDKEYSNSEVNRILSFMYVFNATPESFSESGINLFMTDPETGVSEMIDFNDPGTPMRSYSQMLNPFEVMKASGEMNGQIITDKDISDIQNGIEISPEKKEMFDFAMAKSKAAATIINAFSSYFFSITERDMTSTIRNKYRGGDKQGQVYYSVRVSAQSEATAIKDQWISDIQNKTKELFILDGSDIFGEDDHINTELVGLINEAVDNVLNFQNRKMKLNVHPNGNIEFLFNKKVILTGTLVNYMDGDTSKSRLEFAIPNIPNPELVKGIASLMNNIGIRFDFQIYAIKDILRTNDNVITSKNDYVGAFGRQHMAHLLGMLYSTILIRSDKLKGGNKGKYVSAMKDWLSDRSISFDVSEEEETLSAMVYWLEENEGKLSIAEENKIKNEINVLTEIIQSKNAPKPDMFYSEILELAKRVRSDFDSAQRKNMLTSADRTRYHRIGFASHVDNMVPSLRKRASKIISATKSTFSPYLASERLNKTNGAVTNNNILNGNIVIASHALATGMSDDNFGKGTDLETVREFMKDMIFGHFRDSVMKLRPLALTPNRPGDKRQQRIMNVEFTSNGAKIYNIRKYAKHISGVEIRDAELNNLVYTQAQSYIRRGLMSLAKLLSVQDPALGIVIGKYFDNKYDGQSPFKNIGSYSDNLAVLEEMLNRPSAIAEINAVQDIIEQYYDDVYNSFLQKANGNSKLANKNLSAILSIAKSDDEYMALNSKYDYVVKNGFYLGNASGFRDKTYGLTPAMMSFMQSHEGGDVKAAAKYRDEMYLGQWGNLTSAIKDENIFIDEEIVKMLPGATGNQLTIRKDDDDNGDPVFEWNPFMKLYMYSKDLFSRSYADIMYGPTSQFEDLNMLGNRSKHVESIGTHAITSTATINPHVLPVTTRQIRVYDVMRKGMTASPEDSQTRLLGLYHRYLVDSFGGETGIASTNEQAMKTASFGMNYQSGLGENEKSLESVLTADDYFNSSVGRFRMELMLNGKVGGLTTVHSENVEEDKMYKEALAQWNFFGFFEGRINHYINEKINAKLAEYDQKIDLENESYTRTRDEIEDKYQMDLGTDEEIMASTQDFLSPLKEIISSKQRLEKQKAIMERERSNGGMMIISTNADEIYKKAEDDLYNHVLAIRMMGGPVDPMMAIIGKIVPATASKINDGITNGHNLYNPNTYTNPERPIVTVNHQNANQVLILNPNSDKNMTSRGSQFDYQITLGGSKNISRANEVYIQRNIIARAMEQELAEKVIAIEESYGITDEKKAYIMLAAKQIIKDSNNIPNGDMLAKVLAFEKISYSDPVVQSRIVGQLVKNYNAMIKQKTSGYSYSQRADFTEYFDIPVKYDGVEGTTMITLTRSEFFSGAYDEVLISLGQNPDVLRNTLAPRLSKRMKFLDSAGNDVASERRFKDCVKIVAAEIKLPYNNFRHFDHFKHTLAYYNSGVRPSTLLEMLTLEVPRENGTIGYLNARAYVEEHNNGNNYYKDRTAGLNALNEYLKMHGYEKTFVEDYIKPLLDAVLMVGMRIPYTGPASGQIYEVHSFNYQSNSIADISPEKNDYDNSDQDADKLTFITRPERRNKQISDSEEIIRSVYMDYYTDPGNSELINTAISADAIYKMNANEAMAEARNQRFGIVNEAIVNYNAHQHKQMVGPASVFMKRYAFIMTLDENIRKAFIKYNINNNDIAERGTEKWIAQHKDELKDEYYEDGNMKDAAKLRQMGRHISSNMNMLIQMFLDGEKRPNAQYLNINTSNIGLAFSMAMMGYTIPDIKKALGTITAKKIIKKVQRGTELGAISRQIYDEAKNYSQYMINMNNQEKIKNLIEYRKGKYKYLVDIYDTMLKAHGLTDEYINAHYDHNGVSNMSLTELEVLSNYDPRVNAEEGVKEWTPDFQEKIVKEKIHMERYLNDAEYAAEMDNEYLNELNAKKEEAGQFFSFAEASEAFGLLDPIVGLDQVQKTRPDEILPFLERLRYILGVDLENALIGQGENINAPEGNETWRELAIEKSDMGGDGKYFAATNQETVDTAMTNIIAGVQEAMNGQVVIRGIMTDLNSGVSEGAARAGLANNIPVLGFYSNRSGYNDAFGNYSRGQAFKNRKIMEDLTSPDYEDSNIINLDISESATENEVETTIVEKINSLVGQNDIAIIFDHGQGSLYRTKYHANEFKGRIIHINLNNYMENGVLDYNTMNRVLADRIQTLVSNATAGLNAKNTGVKLYITGSTLYNFANKVESDRKAFLNKMQTIHSKVNTLGLINNIPFIRDNFRRLINDVVKYIPQAYPIYSKEARPVLIRMLNLVGKASYSTKRVYAAVNQAFNAVVYSFSLKEMPGANNIKFNIDGMDYNFNLGDYYDHHPFMMAFSRFIDIIRNSPQYNTNVFMKYLRTDEKGFVVLDFSEKSDLTRQIMREHFNNLPEYTYPNGDKVNIQQLFEFYNIIRFGFEYKAGSITDYVFSVHEKIKPTLDKITDDLNGIEPYNDFREYFESIFADNAVVSYLRSLIPAAIESTTLKDQELGEDEVVIFGRESDYKRSWKYYDDVFGGNKSEEVIYQKTADGNKEVYPIYHNATQTIPLFKATTSVKNLFLESIGTYRRMLVATQAKDSHVTIRFKGQVSFKEGEPVNIYGNEFVVKQVSSNKLDVTFGFSKSLKQNCQ